MEQIIVKDKNGDFFTAKVALLLNLSFDKHFHCPLCGYVMNSVEYGFYCKNCKREFLVIKGKVK